MLRSAVLCLAVSVCAGCGAAPPGPVRGGVAGGSGAVLLGPAAPVQVGSDVVTVLRSGEPTFTELRQLVERARLAVGVEVYEFGRADLASALLSAYARGVAVTVIADLSESAQRPLRSRCVQPASTSSTTRSELG